MIEDGICFYGSSNRFSRIRFKYLENFATWCLSHLLTKVTNMYTHHYSLAMPLIIVWCHYNAVNFLTNIHKRHTIARLLGRAMVCLLWVQPMIDILPHLPQLFIMQYLTILDRIIMALDCNDYCCAQSATVFSEHVPTVSKSYQLLWYFENHITV